MRMWISYFFVVLATRRKLIDLCLLSIRPDGQPIIRKSRNFRDHAAGRSQAPTATNHNVLCMNDAISNLFVFSCERSD